jgi:hypothetical protein
MEPNTAPPPKRTPAEAEALASIKHPELRKLADHAMRAAAERHARGDVSTPAPASRKPPRPRRTLTEYRAAQLERKRTVQQQREARRAARHTQRLRQQSKEHRLHQRVKAKLAAAPHQPNPEACTLIPRWVWIACWSIVGDASGQAGRFYLAKLRNRIAAGAILAAAFDDEAHPHWGNMRVRRIAALGLALAWLGQPTKRKFGYTKLVMGIPRSALGALLADPFDPNGTPVSDTTIGCTQPGQIGYVAKLRAAGALYRQQLTKKYHADELQPCELLGPSGHAPNRYWIVSAVPELAKDPTRAWELFERAGQASRAFFVWLGVLRSRRAQLAEALPP